MVNLAKLPDFWADSGGSESHHGCYVFAMSKGNSIVPWYVGKTSSHNFEGECFTSDKLQKYQRVLLKKPRSRPVLFFLRRPTHKGKRNQKEIDRLETWLIAQAKGVNASLLNRKKVPRETWGIMGVIRTGSGKPSAAAKAFRAAFGIAQGK